MKFFSIAVLSFFCGLLAANVRAQAVIPITVHPMPTAALVDVTKPYPLPTGTYGNPTHVVRIRNDEPGLLGYSMPAVRAYGYSPEGHGDYDDHQRPIMVNDYGQVICAPRSEP